MFVYNIRDTLDFSAGFNHAFSVSLDFVKGKMVGVSNLVMALIISLKRFFSIYFLLFNWFVEIQEPFKKESLKEEVFKYTK